MQHIFALALIVGLGATGVAVADNLQSGIGIEVKEQAISPADIKARMDELGYDVHRLRVGNRNYKAYLVDRQSGGAVKVKFDKATGNLVRAKLAHTPAERANAN